VATFNAYRPPLDIATRLGADLTRVEWTAKTYPAALMTAGHGVSVKIWDGTAWVAAPSS